MIFELEKLIHGEHYLALMLILILSCILHGRSLLSERVHQSSFWITIIACFLLIIQDVLENYAQLDPGRRAMRYITSIAGYALRPAAVLGFLLVVWPSRMKRWFLWIPAVLNALLYSTAWFTPLTFSFNKEYGFSRGPLGWVMIPVCFIYLIMILVVIHIRFRDRRSGDIFVIYLCIFGCLGAMAADIFFDSITIVPAILISSMTFYLFLRSQDTDHDPLTNLWNRLVYYEDCRKLKNSVTAVASVDMNGLKKLNDELGHDAGDRALKTIGHGLRSIMNRKVFAYRVGGDEFMVLFNHCSEEEVQQALVVFQDEMWRAGLSVAIGYTLREGKDAPLEEAILTSDRRMFDEKRMYYQLHDRRQRR